MQPYGTIAKTLPSSEPQQGLTTTHAIINHMVQGLAVAVCAIALTALIALIPDATARERVAVTSPYWLSLGSSRVPTGVFSIAVAAVLVIKRWPLNGVGTIYEGGSAVPYLPRMHMANDHLAAIIVGAYLRCIFSTVLSASVDTDCLGTHDELGCRILARL